MSEDNKKKENIRKELMHEDIKANAIKTLAGGVAHDFNNLLMGIQGNVSLMLLNTDSSHPNYKKLKNIEKIYLR